MLNQHGNNLRNILLLEQKYGEKKKKRDYSPLHCGPNPEDPQALLA